MGLNVRTLFSSYWMRKTQSGDFSNMACLIKKEVAPKNVKAQFEKHFHPNERNVIGDQYAQSLYRLKYQEEPATEKQKDEEANMIFFETSDGEKCAYRLELVEFLKKHIKKFSLRFAVEEYFNPDQSPAAFYSGNNLAGFIMPVRMR